jgi:hypothetical protein
LREFLDSWPYDPNNNVRLARGADGREIIVVRQPIGLETYEVDGRPDGEHPHQMESALEFQLRRLTAAKTADAKAAFKLTTADCAGLFTEGTLYYYRFLNLFRVKDWARAERDTARNLRLIDFVKQYAEHEEDRLQFEHWRPDIADINAVARATILLEEGQCEEARKIARDCIEGMGGIDKGLKSPRKLADALLQHLKESLAIRQVLRPHDESVFMRQGDYWTIRYQGQITVLKASRGLYCLSCLLRHPGREIHVSELLATLVEVRVQTLLGGMREAGDHTITTGLQDAGPILDSQAKAEYRHRIGELRKDTKEAERLNDSYGAAKARGEMDAIAKQLAAAVGLGGRDRRASSDAERARSAVTKRIKDAINRIADLIPPLGHHLAVRIKTGYFCSYNPHPARPVAWKF